MFSEFMLFMAAISLICALDDDNDWRPLVISLLVYLPFFLLINLRMIMINLQSETFFEFSNIFEMCFRLDQALTKFPNRQSVTIEKRCSIKKSPMLHAFPGGDTQLISTQRQRTTNETRHPDQ